MKNRILIYILPLLALVPIFIFRDYTPDNELRYISIIEEALREGSLFAFYNQGVGYADKPPLYFWLLMACRQLTGQNIMLLIGMFTLIPAAVIFYLMDKMSGIAKSAPVLMLLTSVMFIGSVAVLRMDMLMVMFIVLAIYNFYRLYTGTGSRFNTYYLPLNIFLALFAKGPVGVLVPVLSIVVFLLVEGRIKSIGRYLGWRQWTVILGLCAVWFSAVAIEGGADYIHNLLFKQTVGRSINSFHHKAPFYYYFKTIWYAIAPWSLLAVVVIAKGFWQKIIQKSVLLKLYSVVVISTFLMMTLVSSKIDIYLLPIYPFVIYLTLLLISQIRIDWMVKTAIIIPSLLFALSPIALVVGYDQLPIVPPNVILIYIGVAILSVGGLFGLWCSFRANIERACCSISISMLMAIFTISFTIPYFNDNIGLKNLSQKGSEIAMKNGIESFAFYQFRSGENMDVYLGRDLIYVESVVDIKKLNKTILFVRQREISRQSELRELLDVMETEAQVGDYKIYIL